MQENNEKEKYKSVKGYAGLYEISNKGNVKSLKGKTPRKIKPFISSSGYPTVYLYDSNGKKEEKTVHRLVAEVFVPNPHNLPQIDHINSCKTDNNYTNLQWCTAVFNTNKYYNGAKRIRKMDSERNVIEEFDSQKQIMTLYPKYNQPNISMALNGWYKTAYGFIWEYIDE